MTNSKEDLGQVNQKSWDSVYSKSSRRRYPDLAFVHLLMNYGYDREKTKNALVIGSGDGTEVFALTRLGIKVTAVDYSENSVQRLKQFVKDEGVENMVEVFQGDQRDLKKFQNQSYDLAVSWSVISYLSESDGQKAVDEIHKSLRPQGKFIGLFESTDHSGYKQPGVEKVGPRTYWIPESGTKVANAVYMTYYDKDNAKSALSSFQDLKLSHRVWSMPPDAEFRVGQWLFCCTKP